MIRTDIIDRLTLLLKRNSEEFKKQEEARKNVISFIKKKLKEYTTEELQKLKKEEPDLFNSSHYRSFSITDLCNGSVGIRLNYIIEEDDRDTIPEIFEKYITESDREELIRLVKELERTDKDLNEFMVKVNKILHTPCLSTEILRKNIPELFKEI